MYIYTYIYIYIKSVVKENNEQFPLTHGYKNGLKEMKKSWLHMLYWRIRKARILFIFPALFKYN